MAFLDSNWSWVQTALVDPVTPGVYADSNWTYVQGTTLYDPSTGVTFSDSGWKVKNVTLRNPHKPVAIKTGSSTLAYQTIKTKTSGGLIP